MLTNVDARVALRATLYRGFADPSRLALLDALRTGPRTVGDLVAVTGLGQSNASNHLDYLLACGLVTREQRGKFAVYALADARIAGLMDLADGVLADVTGRVYDCARYEVAGGVAQ